VARYEHLPIYKKSMDLTIYFEKIVRNFSRYHKYTLGSELRDKSRAIVGLIIKANAKKEVQAMCKKESYVISAAIVLAIFVVMSFPVMGTAGSLEPSVAPASTMKTLDQIPPTWSQTLPAAQRFELVLNNAGVLDKETGIAWEQSPSIFDQQYWSMAIYACQNKIIGNRKGWRLPTAEELLSLVDPSESNPTLPSGHPFSNVQQGGYWSATTSEFLATDAIAVTVYSGAVSNVTKDGIASVWCVRGGQSHDAY